MKNSIGHNNTAKLYRMVMPKHTCPYGIKARYYLEKSGYRVDDHFLTSREETDSFKNKHNVKTTPQVFIDGERIGGLEETKKFLGYSSSESDDITYKPVIALFITTSLMAVALMLSFNLAFSAVIFANLFIPLSMCALAILKLQDIENFSTMFLNYDLLAKRYVPYAFFYPFAEGIAGVLMLAKLLPFVSALLALFIGSVGALSVFKAVYIDKRELKCACVGGNSKVPLGFVSLTENIMMVIMGLAILVNAISTFQF